MTRLVLQVAVFALPATLAAGLPRLRQRLKEHQQ